jgi:hypothetical protein
MANLNDKGMTRIRRNPDGTYTVTIGGEIVDGEVLDIYAEYSDIPRVVVDPRVEFVHEGNDQLSRFPVEVADQEGVVHVHPTPGQVLGEADMSSGSE